MAKVYSWTKGCVVPERRDPCLFRAPIARKSVAHRLRLIDAPRLFGQRIPRERIRTRSGTTAQVTVFAFTALSLQIVGIAECPEDCLLYTSPSPRDRQK